MLKGKLQRYTLMSVFNHFFRACECSCLLGVIILMIFMSRDTWRNIKYGQLVRGIKHNDSCSRQFSFRGCESTSINILYTIFPPAARLCSTPTTARLNDSTPIMCFTCHYLWRWASARWWKFPRCRCEVRTAPACGMQPDWHRLLWRSKVDVTVALGQVNEGTVPSGTIFHIRCDYKLGNVGHSTPVFNHTQHHISAHMPMVWTVWLNVSRGEDAVLPLYVTPEDWGLSMGTMPQRTGCIERSLICLFRAEWDLVLYLSSITIK